MNENNNHKKQHRIIVIRKKLKNPDNQYSKVPSWKYSSQFRSYKWFSKSKQKSIQFFNHHDEQNKNRTMRKKINDNVRQIEWMIWNWLTKNMKCMKTIRTPCTTKHYLNSHIYLWPFHCCCCFLHEWWLLFFHFFFLQMSVMDMYRSSIDRFITGIISAKQTNSHIDWFSLSSPIVLNWNNIQAKMQ